MTWPATAGDVPDHVTELRTALVACASATAAGIDTARVHFPACDITAARAGSADPLPLLLIETAPIRRRRFAEGMAGVASGTATVRLFTSTSTYSLAKTEKLASDLLKELSALQTGLANLEGERGDASEPSPAARAGGQTPYRSIELLLTWGLEP
jgi:hypothetical protein